MNSLTFPPEIVNIVAELSNLALNKSSITELKSFANPPNTIFLLFKHFIRAQSLKVKDD